MSSTNITTSFTDVSSKGPTRNFNVTGTDDLVVVFEAANASNAAAGGRIKDPSDPTKDLELRGAASHSLPVIDAAPDVRYGPLDGTVTSCRTDDAPMPH